VKWIAENQGAFWVGLGWLGNVIFFSRFWVQWWATERRKRTVIPESFWWLSLVGSGCLLAYSLAQKNSVFILAYALNWIPYARNLVILRRHRGTQIGCPSCEESSFLTSNFCPSCGTRLITPKADR
jgi:lipid-A-disaccharide synthase-like uncharacterized protein